METVAKALRMKSGRKGDREVASGSSKNKKVPNPEAERGNSVAGAIAWWEESKWFFGKRRERAKAVDDKTKGEASTERMEVEKEVLEKPQTLEKEGPEKNKIDNSAATTPHTIRRVNLDFLCMEREDDDWAEWEANFESEETPTIPEAKKIESVVEWEMKRKEEDKADLEMTGSDLEAWHASQFCGDWNYVWSGRYGSFEDTTRIPSMRFTYKPVIPPYGFDTLQIFSVKVAATRGGLQWPLDVFGMVAMRDCVDHNRNIIFQRERENCQTLTEKNRNLVLVGPSRAVVLLNPHPVIIEVDLKVKGTTESEDRYLSFLAAPLVNNRSFYSRPYDCAHTSKLSTLQFSFAHIVRSVEATIFVWVIRGSWPDDFHGEFAAFTTGIHGKFISGAKKAAIIDREKFVLLDSSCEKVLVNDDGKIKLSRRVVSVETGGKLKVSVRAWKGKKKVVKKSKVFKTLEGGVSDHELDTGFCKMEIKVYWSLISSEPVPADFKL